VKVCSTGAIPGPRWLVTGFKAGADQSIARSLYYIALPALYLASRFVLIFLCSRNFFGAVHAPTPHANTSKT
jgi:hypothetical protein